MIMKNLYQTIAICLFAGLFAACTVQEPLPEGYMTFHAASGDDFQTKTVLQEGTQVHWCPGDEINVFCGNLSGRFVSTNTAVAATAEFTGELPGYVPGGDPFVAVYPFAAENTFDGNVVTLTVPSKQNAVEGTFADDLFISLAMSSDDNLSFYNLCGGVKFSVAVEGVKYVVFRGNNGETLAGKVKVGISKSNTPIVNEVIAADTEIVLSAPGGETFKTGVWYYIVSLPANLTEGYEIDLYGDTLIGTKKGAAVQVQRSVWGVLTDLGKQPEPEPVHVESVSLSEESLTLTEGDSAQLTATVLPEEADDKSVEWSSSDDDIATVDASGLVTAVTAGTATITVTTVDGGFTATCEVTVEAAETPGPENPDTPDTPDPGNPDNPDNPNPENPETPDTPNEP